MSIIPRNLIVENQYTYGGEFFELSTGKSYKGYYCIVQEDKYYTGKTYISTSIELVKTKPTISTDAKVNSSFPDNRFGVRYFSKKINNNPILIKEINKDTYNQLLNNPFYQVLSIDGTQIFSGSRILDEANKKMVGLKTFLLG